MKPCRKPTDNIDVTHVCQKVTRPLCLTEEGLDGIGGSTNSSPFPTEFLFFVVRRRYPTYPACMQKGSEVRDKKKTKFKQRLVANPRGSKYACTTNATCGRNLHL